MGNELLTLQERIAEKVGDTLLDLIPEEQWNKLVADQIHHFMTQKAPGVIQDALVQHMKDTLQKALQQPEYQGTWGQYGEQLAGEAVRDILEKSAPVIFAAMLAPVADGVIQDLRNRLTQGVY